MSKKKLIYALAMMVAISVASSQAAAQQAIQFSEENLRLLDVRYERYRLGNGIEGYLLEDQLYLALVDIAALLELRIDVNELSASGRIGESFGEFDLAYEDQRWQLLIENKPIDVGQYDIAVHQGTIFVASPILELWFPISIRAKLEESYIAIETERSLPFETSLARRERVFDRSGGVGSYEYDIYDSPYAWWETPSADIRLDHSTTRNTDLDRTVARNTRYSFIGNGDIGKMNSNVFLTGDRDIGITSFSARFDRFDTERNLLGPMGLSRISIGDVTAPGVRSSFGRGFLVSNESNSNRLVTDVTEIEGNHYPGWEVELYLGDTVVDYQIIGEDGSYKFSDVILSQGVNDYRLVFYGPAGEKEQESRSLFFGDTDEDMRRLRYSFSMNQPNTRLYQVNEDLNDSDTWQANLMTRFTVTNGLTLNAGYTGLILDDKNLTDQQRLLDDNTEQYLQLGLTANWRGHSFQVRANKDNDDPYALTYGLGGDFKRLDYRINYTDFRVEDSADNDVHSQMNTTLRYRFGGLSSVLDWRRNSFGEYEEDEAELFFSGRYKRINWSKGFEYVRDFDGSDYDQQAFGQVFAGSTLGPITGRLNAGYSIAPEVELTSMGFASNIRLNNDVNVNFNYNRSIATDVNTYTLGMKWALPFLTVTPSVSYTDNGFIRGNVNMLMTMGARTGTLGDYFSVDRRSSSSRGTVRARLFEDENGDGQYNRGERLLSGGIIHSLQTRQKATSDDVGVATLTNVRAWFPSDIIYESDTVEDFSLRYGGGKFAIEARPGKVMQIDMPFYRAGDIDGVVTRQYSNADRRYARGVTVELIDAQGQLISTAVAASDGFFSFQKVLPGRYRVRVRGEQMLSGNEREVVIGSEGNFVGDFNITIAARGNNLQGSENTLVFLTQQSDGGTGLVERAPIAEQTARIEPQAESVTQPLAAASTQPAVLTTNSGQTQVEPILESAPAALSNPIETPQAPVAEQLTVVPAVSVNSIETQRAEPAPVPQVVRQQPLDPWSLQLGSYSQLANVQALTQKLQAGDTPFFTQAISTANGDFTRVFAGPYSGRAAALQAKTDLDQQFNVRSLPVAVGE